LPAPFDGYLQDLLWDLAVWLSYGKLRQHTDSTLNSFQVTTTSLGFQIRKFANTICPQFRTKETPREENARNRRAAAKKAKEAAKAAASGAPLPPEQQKKKASGARFKLFSLATYKLHALGDYLRSILLFGTTDSYSTQIVSRPSPTF
jgi:hypothetical protein